MVRILSSDGSTLKASLSKASCRFPAADAGLSNVNVIVLSLTLKFPAEVSPVPFDVICTLLGMPPSGLVANGTVAVIVIAGVVPISISAGDAVMLTVAKGCKARVAAPKF